MKEKDYDQHKLKIALKNDGLYMIQYKKSEMRTIDVNIKGGCMTTLKTEQNGEQNNNYFIMKKVETKETKETEIGDLQWAF
jgi:hypothetical protein